jgi:hypothetical protein
VAFLERLKKILYKPGAYPQERPREPESLAPEEVKLQQGLKAEQQWEQFERRGLTQAQWRTFWRGVAVALILIFAGGLIIYFQLTAFKLEKVELTLEAPSQVFAGKEVDLKFHIANQNRSGLEKVKLTVFFPAGTFDPKTGEILREQSFEIGALEAGQEEVQDLKVRLLGPLEEVKEIRARLAFVPSSIESPLEKEIMASIQVASVPVEVFLESSNDIVAGEEFSVKISFINVSEMTFNDLRLQLITPAGFKRSGAYPEPGFVSSIWDIPELAPQEEGEITVRGTLSGAEGVRREFKVELLQGTAKLAQDTRLVRIISAPLALEATINGRRDLVGQLGQRLSVKFSFTNNFNVGLRDLRLETKFQGELFDFSTLKTQGDFDPLTNTITWGPAEGRAFQILAPGESGKASFVIKLKKKFPVKSFQDKNFELELLTRLVAENVPELLGVNQVSAEHELVIPMETDLALKTLGFYQETRAPIGNSGPIPPRVGQGTTYTLHWQVVNLGNEVQGAVIKAKLPSWVNWTGKTHANVAREALVYDSKLREITWRIEKIPAGTGKVLPAYEAVFQVELIPAPNQRRQFPDLIGESEISGQDSFTQTQVRAFAPVVNTTLPDDPTISANDGIVQ